MSQGLMQAQVMAVRLAVRRAAPWALRAVVPSRLAPFALKTIGGILNVAGSASEKPTC